MNKSQLDIRLGKRVTSEIRSGFFASLFVKGGMLQVTVYNQSFDQPIMRLFLGNDEYLTYLYESKKFSKAIFENLSQYFYKTGCTYRDNIAIVCTEEEKGIACSFMKTGNRQSDLRELITEYQKQLKIKKHYISRWKVDAAFRNLGSLPEDMDAFAVQNVLDDQNIMIINRRSGKGYCSRCHDESDYHIIPDHKTDSHCSKCGKKTRALHKHHYERTKILNAHGTINYLKNTPFGVVVIHLDAVRKMSQYDFTITYHQVSRIVLQPKSTLPFELNVIRNNGIYGRDWHKSTVMQSGMYWSRNYLYTASAMYPVNLEKEIAYTESKYSALKEFTEKQPTHDILAYLQLYKKIPSIEKFVKEGFDNIISEYLIRYTDYSTNIINTKDIAFDLIKPDRKNVASILNINQDQVRYIKEMNPTLSELRLYLLSINTNQPLSLSDIQMLLPKRPNHSFSGGQPQALNKIRRITEVLSLKRLLNYLKRQEIDDQWLFIRTIWITYQC